ncbi:MAG: CDP-alcohol phosphatidyltransferase family protein [Candidatus Aramenus sp.]|jgi:archaetidylinositol phosphate synthase|nr:CDP-alcohol phosphatidyltransferase family protein [Candidatus Aramenus sp.]
MITRLRKESKKLITPIASAFLRVGFTANAMTLTGLALAVAFLLVVWATRNALYGVVLLALSSLADALDGEIARLSGKAGPFGSFLDSSLDRIEDAVFISSFVLLGFQPVLVSLLVGLSLSISYLRAKAESLGVRAEGKGIIERGERLIFVAVILLVSPLSFEVASVLFYALFVLSAVTVVQRFLLVSSALPK